MKRKKGKIPVVVIGWKNWKSNKNLNKTEINIECKMFAPLTLGSQDELVALVPKESGK